MTKPQKHETETTSKPLRKWCVTLTIDTTMSAHVEVLATSEDEACELAYDANISTDLEYSVADCWSSDSAYVTDVDLDE